MQGVLYRMPLLFPQKAECNLTVIFLWFHQNLQKMLIGTDIWQTAKTSTCSDLSCINVCTPSSSHHRNACINNRQTFPLATLWRHWSMA